MRVIKDGTRNGPLADGAMTVIGHFGDGHSCPNDRVAQVVATIVGTKYRVVFGEAETSRLALASIGDGRAASTLKKDYLKAYMQVGKMTVRQLRDAEIARRLNVPVDDLAEYSKGD